MDFEDELQLNIIKKSTNDRNQDHNGNVRTGRTSAQKYKIFDYIPLTLNHLANLKQDAWGEHNVVSIFDGRIHFKNCMVYCTVLAKSEKAKSYNYLMDDGTESLEINYHRKLKDLDRIQKLENDVNTIQESMAHIAKCLRNILSETRKQLCSTSNIEPRSRVLVFGKPSYFRENVSIDAFYIVKDDSADRRHEIAFKNELIDWYKSNILSI